MPLVAHRLPGLITAVAVQAQQPITAAARLGVLSNGAATGAGVAIWMRFAAVSVTSVTLKDGLSPSRHAGLMGTPSACPRWPPIWSVPT